MRYAIYFTWREDDTSDSFNVSSAKERDINITEMLKRQEQFSKISYCPIYANEEYGKTTVVR